MERTLESRNRGFYRFFKRVEIIGNRLPHPMWIFIYLIGIVMVLSLVLSLLGVSVTYTQANSDGTVEVIEASVVNLFSRGEIQNFFTSFITEYASNPVLGNALVIGMCMALAEDTGFFEAFLRRSLLHVPRGMTTLVLAFMGICANIAGDSGQILAATLGAVVFKAVGRNPWIGIVTGYAAASAGYTANLLVANADVTLSSITGSIAESLGYTGFHPLINWYFLLIATPILAVVTAVIVEKFMTRLIGDYETDQDESGIKKYSLSKDEKRGLKFAAIGTGIYVVLLLLATVPSNGILRNNDGSLLPKSPFISSTVVFVALLFAISGACYGFGCRKLTNKNQIPKMMQKGIGKVSGLLTMLLPVSLFITIFTRSNLATVLSVKGQELLESINLNGFPLFIIFILFTAFINLFMNSGSAKWFIFAPIFVPMFARMGIHPALTQLIYRIGDSCTNNIAPLNASMMVGLALMDQYKREGEESPGMGTLMSYQLPFSIAYLVTFILQLAVFYFFDLPIGPGIIG